MSGKYLTDEEVEIIIHAIKQDFGCSCSQALSILTAKESLLEAIAIIEEAQHD